MDEDDIFFLKEVKGNCRDQRAKAATEVKIKLEPGTESGLQSDEGPSETSVIKNEEGQKTDRDREGQNFASEVSGSSFTNPSEKEESQQSEENILPLGQQTVTLTTDPSKLTEESTFETLKLGKKGIAVPSNEDISNSCGSENFQCNVDSSETNVLFSTGDFEFLEFEKIIDSESPTTDQPSENTLVTNDSQEMSPLEISGPFLACKKEEPAEKAESTNANFFCNCDIPIDIVDLTGIPISSGGNESSPFLETANTSAGEDASTDKTRRELISCSANEISHLGLLETPTTTQSSSAVEISSAPQPIPTLGREYASENFPLSMYTVQDSQLNEKIIIYSPKVVPPLDKIVAMNHARFPSSGNDDASRNPPIAIQPPKSSSNDNDKDGKCVPKYRKAIAVHEKNKMLERNRYGSTENKILTTTPSSKVSLAYNMEITDNSPTTNTSQNQRKISLDPKYFLAEQASINSSTGRGAGCACASDQLFLGGSQNYSGGSIMTEPSMWFGGKKPEKKRAYRKRKTAFPSLQDSRCSYPNYQFYESSKHHPGGFTTAEPSTTVGEKEIPIIYKRLISNIDPEENFQKKPKRARSSKLSGVSSNKRETLSKRGQYRPRRTVSDAPADIHENIAELPHNHEETISQLKTTIHLRKSNSSDMYTERPKRQRTKSASTTRKRDNSCSGKNKKAPITAQSPVATITAPQDSDLIFPSYEGNLICGNNEATIYSDSPSVLLNALSSGTNLKPGTSPNATSQVKSTSTKEPAHTVSRDIFVGFSAFPNSELVPIIEGHYSNFSVIYNWSNYCKQYTHG